MTSFKHKEDSGHSLNVPVGKVVCVGRNYREHAKELNNPIPLTPILFMKPVSSVCDWNDTVWIPQNKGSCHHEIELAVLISQPLTNVDSADALDSVSHFGLALDLTLRDRQDELKQQGHPWELAKAFDRSCPITSWIPFQSESQLNESEIELKINDQRKQSGLTQNMIWSVAELLSIISHHFSLQAGDIVLTGTPSGVGPLNENDHLQAFYNRELFVESTIKTFQ